MVATNKEEEKYTDEILDYSDLLQKLEEQAKMFKLFLDSCFDYNIK